jgi:hypothetical protein
VNLPPRRKILTNWVLPFAAGMGYAYCYMLWIRGR